MWFVRSPSHRIRSSSPYWLLRNGFVGKALLPPELHQKRRALARAEIEHFTGLLAQEPIGVQIGVVRDALPQTGFQIFRQPGRQHTAGRTAEAARAKHAGSARCRSSTTFAARRATGRARGP